MTRHPDRPDSLDLFPGECARPPLRLLEHPAMPSRGRVQRAPAPHGHWLARLRSAALRALAQ